MVRPVVASTTRTSSRQALEMTDTADLRDRPLDQLSGGQRQRAWIAMTLAQHTDLLLLDEPTTFLDLAHQVEVLDLVSRLNRERGRTVAMVLHDLNLAARYSDLIVVMKDGAIVTQGAAARGVHRRAAAPTSSASTPRAPRPAHRPADHRADVLRAPGARTRLLVESRLRSVESRRRAAASRPSTRLNSPRRDSTDLRRDSTVRCPSRAPRWRGRRRRRRPAAARSGPGRRGCSAATRSCARRSSRRRPRR